MDIFPRITLENVSKGNCTFFNCKIALSVYLRSTHPGVLSRVKGKLSGSSLEQHNTTVIPKKIFAVNKGDDDLRNSFPTRS